MATPMQPEFFLLLGIDLFLAISLLSCLLDKHFPWQLPYLYQVASLAGFGQLIVAKEFMTVFGDYTRFWFSMLYLIVALANIIAVNVYIGFIKRMFNYAKAFLVAVSFPSLAITTFFLSNYSSVATHPTLMLPVVSWETSFVVIVAFDTGVVALGMYLFFKPKWRYIFMGSVAAIAGSALYAFLKPSWGSAVFVVSAIALGIGCILVLSTSLYILVRTWKENLTERRRKGR